MEKESMLVQVGIVRNADGVRELFIIDGTLAAFNSDESCFDVIGTLTDSCITSNQVLTNNAVNQVCTAVAASVSSTEVDLVIIYDGIVNRQVNMFGYVDKQPASLKLDLDTTELITGHPLTKSEWKDLDSCRDYFENGNSSTIENTALVSDYKKNFITV